MVSRYIVYTYKILIFKPKLLYHIVIDILYLCKLLNIILYKENSFHSLNKLRTHPYEIFIIFHNLKNNLIKLFFIKLNCLLCNIIHSKYRLNININSFTPCSSLNN